MQSTYYIEETNEDVTDKVNTLFADCEHCVKRVRTATRIWNYLFQRDQFRRFYYVELAFREEIIRGYEAAKNVAYDRLNAFTLHNNVMCHSWSYPSGGNEVCESISRL